MDKARKGKQGKIDEFISRSEERSFLLRLIAKIRWTESDKIVGCWRDRHPDRGVALGRN